MFRAKVVSFISTKGGAGKSTLAVNLGALCADAGFKVLLIDTDFQPSSTSCYEVAFAAPGGFFELVAQRITKRDVLISKTVIPRLDLIASNDRNDLLPTMLRNTPDGLIRLYTLLPDIGADYDLILIDTPGTHSILVEAAVLASSVCVSPVNPETLSAREFRRGTVRLLNDLTSFTSLGVRVPNILAVLNKVDATVDARVVAAHLKETLKDDPRVRVLDTKIPSTVTFRDAATRGLPVHRIEVNQCANRKRPPLFATMKALAAEIFPEWEEQILAVGQEHFKFYEGMSDGMADALLAGERS